MAWKPNCANCKRRFQCMMDNDGIEPTEKLPSPYLECFSVAVRMPENYGKDDEELVKYIEKQNDRSRNK